MLKKLIEKKQKRSEQRKELSKRKGSAFRNRIKILTQLAGDDNEFSKGNDCIYILINIKYSWFT